MSIRQVLLATSRSTELPTASFQGRHFQKAYYWPLRPVSPFFTNYYFARIVFYRLNFVYFPWPPLDSELPLSKRITLTNKHTRSITNIAILVLTDEDHAEISYRIVDTLIHVYSVTYCSQKSIHLKTIQANSSNLLSVWTVRHHQLYQVIAISENEHYCHTLGQFKSLQHDKFLTKFELALTVNKAQLQTLKRVAIYEPSPLLSISSVRCAIKLRSGSCLFKRNISHGHSDVTNGWFCLSWRKFCAVLLAVSFCAVYN
jgi:hypothetical protein